MPDNRSPANLRAVADLVGVTASSVSVVLNGVPTSAAIPQCTKDRIFRAAQQLHYLPNLAARSLRTKRTYIVAVISADISHPRVVQIVAGVERHLRPREYLLALRTFDPMTDGDTLSVQVKQRGIEGLIAVDTVLPDLRLPVVAIDLRHLVVPEPMEIGMLEWLRKLGQSASEVIVEQIGNKSSQRMNLIAQVSAEQGREVLFPPVAYFHGDPDGKGESVTPGGGGLSLAAT